MDEMAAILVQCQSEVEHHYPNLNKEIQTISHNLLADKLPETKNELFNGEYLKLMAEINEKLVASSQAYQTNPALMLDSLAKQMHQLYLGDSTDESLQCKIVKKLVGAYFKITKNQMKDLVAKIVVRFLVDAFVENLQEELTSRLHKEERFDELFFESADLSIKRKATADMLKAAKRAQEVLGHYKSK